MLKAVLGMIAFVVALSVAVNSVTTKKVLSKARRFCDTEVIVGKSTAGLIEKSRNAGAKFYSSESALNIDFTGSFRPAICRVSLINGIVTGKQLEMPD